MSATPSDLTPDFQINHGSAALPNGITTRIVSANPNRYSLTFWSIAAVVWQYAPTNAVGAGPGFTASPTPPIKTWTFADVGPVVCGEWFGFTAMGPLTVRWTEVIYQPRREL